MDVFWQVVGWIASVVLVISLMQTRIMRLRIINLTGCILSVVFNAVVANWPVLGLNIALSVINIYQLWRLTHSRHDPAAYDVVRVEPTSPLADKFVAHHAADIAAEIPDHNPADLEVCDDLFVVMRGDEIMGLVAMRKGADGEGQVVLDYVTPPYRDTTPGEFVFRTSNVLTERGYSSVRAPIGKVRYYTRIGFTQDQAGYHLALTA